MVMDEDIPLEAAEVVDEETGVGVGRVPLLLVFAFGMDEELFVVEDVVFRWAIGGVAACGTDANDKTAAPTDRKDKEEKEEDEDVAGLETGVVLFGLVGTVVVVEDAILFGTVEDGIFETVEGFISFSVVATFFVSMGNTIRYD